MEIIIDLLCDLIWLFFAVFLSALLMYFVVTYIIKEDARIQEKCASQIADAIKKRGQSSSIED